MADNTNAQIQLDWSAWFSVCSKTEMTKMCWKWMSLNLMGGDSCCSCASCMHDQVQSGRLSSLSSVWSEKRDTSS